ncbi:MAG: molybdopterin-dependent oxidoreductase [Deferribacterota bacterium]|nr:molybdopterin-dependent oxidoreductase [Deferribacterota bacterium]
MSYIYINGKKLVFNEGETILQVANRYSIEIPTLCYHKDLPPIGACRLCVVEIKGINKLSAACETVAQPGMEIFTDTEKVKQNRIYNLQQVLLKHPLDCPICDKGGECVLQDITYKLGVDIYNLTSDKPKQPVENWEMILYNPNLCVLCERCVKFCHLKNGTSALKIDGSAYYCGIKPKINPLDCDFCGLCVDNCPVGALLDIPFRHSKRVWDLTFKKNPCMNCPLGCEINYGIANNYIFRTKSVNGGSICDLGRYGFAYIYNDERLTEGLIKNNNDFQKDGVDYLIKKISSNLKESINEYGPESVCFLVGSRLSNEAIYTVKELAEKIGTNKIISDVEFCDNGFLGTYKDLYGTYLAKGKIGDISNSDLIILLGADLSREFKGLKWNIMDAVVKGETKIVTIGIKNYDYDNFVDHSILVEYADFTKAINNIINSSEKGYNEIRELIKNAKNVSLIVGDEYIQCGDDFSSLFDITNFIGLDNIISLQTGLNKGNFRSILLQGIYSNQYSVSELLDDLKNGKIKHIIWANFYPYKFLSASKELIDGIEKVRHKVCLDLFLNDFNKLADIILPVRSYYEKRGSYITLDGRIVKADELIKGDSELGCEVKYLAKLASELNIALDNNYNNLFDKFIEGVTSKNIKFIDNYLVSDLAINPNFNKNKAKKDKDNYIYINKKHINGLTLKYSYINYEDNKFKKTYIPQAEDNIDRLISRYKIAKGVKIKLKDY